MSTSVYNLLREACGISQSEAADHIHETRLDTVKSWSSDRRPAPQWAINQMQSMVRRIRAAGETFAEQIKQRAQGQNVFVIGLPHDDDDARACGFPSSAAQHQAIAIAISLLPDDAEIRLVARVRGSIPAPVLQLEKVEPTATDRHVLMTMSFLGNQCTTEGNMNRRKFERLEDIGWIKGFAVNLSDVTYELTAAGKEARAVRPGDRFRLAVETGGEERAFRVEEVTPAPRPNMFSKDKANITLVDDSGIRITRLDKEIRSYFIGPAG
ncbi:hypothetical protein [Bradyrhizobium sp. NAS96.2]|uniref:hypothetical protein n=1 Tax=Bradyrhizobium sp. NAS96.2 TaxID=1680160 RepID=UPI00093E0705|nr:hypothetical protein [Bradyrhizobium sp. NAS96.2]OKO67340.1 hypothetical protein AC628_39505 [Bradyrhizobium sp. NAS96.2]